MDFMPIAMLVGVVAACVWITLPVVYLFTAPDWRRTKAGRALMYLLGSTSAMFLILLTSRLFGNYPGKAFFHAGIYALVMLAGIRLAVLFVELRIELGRLIQAEAARDALNATNTNRKENQ